MLENEDVDYAALREVFRVEADELTRSLEESTFLLERDPTDSAPLAAMCRIVHTIKGGARMVGFAGLAEFSVTFEELLSAVRERQVTVSTALSTLFLRVIEVLRGGFVTALDGDVSLTPELEQMSCELRQVLSSLAESGAQAPEVFEPARPVDSRAKSLALTSASRTVASGARGGKSIRVKLDKLQRVLDCIGEIETGRGRIMELIDCQLEFSRDELSDLHHAYDGLYSKLRVLAMDLRMVPLGPLFQDVARMCRGIALDCGKKVQVAFDGEDVEVDAPIVEILRDPLLELARNAVEHGIEDSVQRIQNGKPAVGRVALSACREDGYIVVSVADDGEGLDRDRILSCALTRGIIQLDAEMSDAEVHQLVLRSGFSTIDETAENSRRGVGLDVVVRNVERLQGTIRVQSQTGSGSAFAVKFPLTLS